MESRANPGCEAPGRQCHHRYLWPVIQALLPGGEPLEILDAGCGSGYLTARMAAMGHSMTGIDLCLESVATARERYPDLRFFQRSVYDQLSDLCPCGWDVVVAVELIEHLCLPKAFLRNMVAVLKPGGWLILSTPYHGYWKNLALSLVNGWDRHVDVQWEGGHVKFFSRASLSRLLDDAGFGDPEYRYAGRVAFFWKSMACRVRRVDRQGKTEP